MSTRGSKQEAACECDIELSEPFVIDFLPYCAVENFNDYQSI